MIDKSYCVRLNLLLFLLVFGFSLNETFAQSETHPGVVQYRAGRNAEALQSLSLAVKQKEYKASGEMWNYLGLAHLAADENKKARKAFDRAIKLDPAKATYRVNSGYAFLMLRKLDQAQSEIEKALKLDPNIAGAYYIRGIANLWEGKFDSAMNDAERAIQIDPTNDTGYTLKSDALVAMLGKRIEGGSTARAEVDLLRQAVETLTLGASAVPKLQNNRKIDEELEAMKAFHAYFSRELPDPTVPKPDPEPGVTPLKIISKRAASYTDSARQAGVQGTITMAVLFGASGRIEHTLLIKRLGYGLDEQALKAARAMKFEPKKKDGTAVSTVRLVSYGFNIY
jgi:TonB family protein